jgi:17beta-estradiol 17-dehydrogenase / very-long-chain 3-oxoacyl-CoA reductase
MIAQLLQYLGAAAVAYIAICLLFFVKRVFLASGGATLSRILKKGGAWAVVTGASDGIGRAIAVELGRRGFNVVLIARTVSKLEEVAAEIKAKRPDAQTKVIPFDFSKGGDAEYNALFAQLDAYDIGVLANNVGINYAFPQGIDACDVAEDLSILKVNCESQLRMTKYVVGKMKQKKAGAILSLGSFTSSFPTALLSTYSGTKAFNAAFSDALAIELAEHGISVLTVTPNLVISRMTAGEKADKAKPSFMRVAANAMARATVSKIGAVTRTAGHTNHELIEAIASLVPRNFFNTQVLASQKAINKKALKIKAAKEAAAAKTN